MKIKGKTYKTLDGLSRITGIPVKTMVYYANNMSQHVKTFEIKKRKGGIRRIAAPQAELKRIQRTLKDYVLAGYQYPSYVFGLGGNTLADHALMHAGEKTLISVDIRDFYPSITNRQVYKMWSQTLGFDAQSSRILTQLCTLNGGVMQGFPTSSHVAAIVAEGMTRSIDEYCRANNMTFSQYVDDLNISGNQIDYRSVFKILVEQGRKNNLSIKKTKTKVSSEKDGKSVTGVSFHGENIRASKDIRRRAIRALKEYSNNPSDEVALRRVNGYLGFLKHINKADGRKYKALVDRIKSGDSFTK